MRREEFGLTDKGSRFQLKERKKRKVIHMGTKKGIKLIVVS